MLNDIVADFVLTDTDASYIFGDDDISSGNGGKWKYYDSVSDVSANVYVTPFRQRRFLARKRISLSIIALCKHDHFRCAFLIITFHRLTLQMHISSPTDAHARSDTERVPFHPRTLRRKTLCILHIPLPQTRVPDPTLKAIPGKGSLCCHSAFDIGRNSNAKVRVKTLSCCPLTQT
jgi:hypothetical protein